MKDELAPTFRAELQWCSDGRFFEEDTVANELKLWMQRTLAAHYEVGRRLCWAKAELPHGKFEAWVKEKLGISQDTAGRYMRVAEFFQVTPKARIMLSSASPTQILALAKSDPETVSDILNGRIAGLEPDTISDTPVKKLEEKLKKLETAKTAAETAAASATADKTRLEQLLSEANKARAESSEKLLDATRIRWTKEAKEAHDLMFTVGQRTTDALNTATLQMLGAGARVASGDLGPEVAGRVIATASHIATMAQLIEMQVRRSVGEFIPADALDSLYQRYNLKLPQALNWAEQVQQYIEEGAVDSAREAYMMGSGLGEEEARFQVERMALGEGSPANPLPAEHWLAQTIGGHPDNEVVGVKVGDLRALFEAWTKAAPTEEWGGPIPKDLPEEPGSRRKPVGGLRVVKPDEDDGAIW